VGNVITPKVLKVKGLIFFDPVTSASWNWEVRAMIVTNKTVRSQAMLTAAGADYVKNLLWDGQSGTPTTYLGCEPYYNQLPINRRNWNVLFDKKINLRKGLSDAAITPPCAAETFKSPTRSVPFEFVLTQKQLPAKFVYDAAGATSTDLPTNFAPVLALGWVDEDGAIQVGNTAQGTALRVQWTSTLIYEDA